MKGSREKFKERTLYVTQKKLHPATGIEHKPQHWEMSIATPAPFLIPGSPVRGNLQFFSGQLLCF